MILAASAVTIYFVGLVHFHDSSGTGREVVIPLAPAHRTEVIIKGLEHGKDDCKSPDDWSDATSSCTISGISGTTIALPPATSGVLKTTRDFQKIPNLETLCPAIGDIRPDVLTDSSKYAARLTITSGTLDAFTNDKAWVSFLTTDAGTLTIGTARSFPLSAGAVVWITNSPPPESGGGSSSMRHRLSASTSHFLLYYLLYNGAGGCTALPAETTSSHPVPASFKRVDSGASGDVGCSNSTCCTH